MGTLYQYIDTSDKRTIVIGDIHGCYDELIALLEQINFSESDCLVTTGDLVDRGPATWKVAEFFLNTHNAFSVLGNHERRIAGVIRKTIPPAWSQLHSLSKLHDEEWLLWASFFESLPCVIETSDAIIVHARIDPAKDIMNQDPYFTCAVGGTAIIIEKDTNGIPLWFYDFVKNNVVNKPVCIGHMVQERVILIKDNLYALDTGVVKGGPLTALILPSNELKSVRTGTNHFDISLREWNEEKSLQIPLYQQIVGRYIKLKNKDNHTTQEQSAIKAFEAELILRDIKGKIEPQRVHLIKIFGNVPDPGPIRGYYFKNIRDKLPVINSRFLKFIFSTKALEISDLLKIFEGNTLNEIDELIKELSEKLNCKL